MTSATLAGRGQKDATRAAQAPATVIAPATLRRDCLECGTGFYIKPGPGRHKTYCSTTCRERYAARCAARGKVLVPYAIAWRVGRNSKKIKDNVIFREVIAILDEFADEDRKAGRPMPADYVERQLAGGYLYRDRKRR